MAAVAEKPPQKLSPEQQIAQWHKEGYVWRYNAKWEPIRDNRGKAICFRPDWMIEWDIIRSEQKPSGWRGEYFHFMKFVEAVWGDPRDKDGWFQANPNAQRMIKHALEEKFLAIAGSASSGKSRFLALWVVANFLLWPDETKCLITSMTIQTGEMKVWGFVCKFYNRACRVMGAPPFGGDAIMPGKLIASKHIIKRRDDAGKLHSTEGIELVPAEASEFKTCAKKLQGIKAMRLIVALDELETLAQNILETVKENLFANEGLKVVAGFNPESWYSPGGIMSTPEGGWDQVDADCHEWRTAWPHPNAGLCIKFDATLSPNITGPPIWEGLMTIETLRGYLAIYPETAPGYWKMVRAHWSPTGTMDSIYTGPELESHRATRKCNLWESPPVPIAGFDPSFTHGGDRAVLCIGQVGMAQEWLSEEEIKAGKSPSIKKTVEHVKTYVLDEDVTKKGEDKNEQIVKLAKSYLEKHHVLTQNVALDLTGGHAFGALLAREIGQGFLGVVFSGTASDHMWDKFDKRDGKRAFRDRMSEIWYVGKSLVREEQIRGLTADIMVEMCARAYKESNGKIEVEEKSKMKLRIKRSPDKADAFFLMVDVARQRHGLSSTEKALKTPRQHGPVPTDANPFAGINLLGKSRATFSGMKPASMPGGGWAQR